jgi:hypothetical protein
LAGFVEIQVFSSQGGFDSPDVPGPLRFEITVIGLPANKKDGLPGF